MRFVSEKETDLFNEFEWTKNEKQTKDNNNNKWYRQNKAHFGLVAEGFSAWMRVEVA